MLNSLTSFSRLVVKQSFELAELFGFETRNKYRICNEHGEDVAFAAEQQKGFIGILFRQFLGHWRTFDLHFFDTRRQEFMIAHHPFRWYFQRLEVREPQGRRLGVIERRFAILSKRFVVEDSNGRELMSVYSPFFKFWTFPFATQGRERARVLKRWSGVGYEMFTDKDSFLVEYLDTSLSVEERGLVLSAAIYIDLKYFERKGSGGGLNALFDS